MTPLFPGFAHYVRTSRSAGRLTHFRFFWDLLTTFAHPAPLEGGALQKHRPATFARTSSARMQVYAFAERTGFEPVSRFRRLHAFQACLFNHSSIFPVFRLQIYAKFIDYPQSVHALTIKIPHRCVQFYPKLDTTLPEIVKLTPFWQPLCQEIPETGYDATRNQTF